MEHTSTYHPPFKIDDLVQVTAKASIFHRRIGKIVRIDNTYLPLFVQFESDGGPQEGAVPFSVWEVRKVNK